MTETAPPATTPSGRNDELIALALVDTLSCLNQVDEMLEDVKRFQHV